MQFSELIVNSLWVNVHIYSFGGRFKMLIVNYSLCFLFILRICYFSSPPHFICIHTSTSHSHNNLNERLGSLATSSKVLKGASGRSLLTIPPPYNNSDSLIVTQIAVWPCPLKILFTLLRLMKKGKKAHYWRISTVYVALTILRKHGQGLLLCVQQM